MLTLQADKSSPLHFLHLDAGLFVGNGIKLEPDNRRDFISHLAASGRIGANIEWGLGASCYYGFVQNATDNRYQMEEGGFHKEEALELKGSYSKRTYWGLDGQWRWASALGVTHLRAEYLWGTQPSSKESFRSPNASTAPSGDSYLRKFTGGYATLVQDLGRSPLSLVLKYEWLDPNTQVQNEALGLGGTTSTDATQQTFGMGLLWYINKNVRLQTYYDIPLNEQSTHLSGYTQDRKDNVFTLRLQYKF